MMMNRIRGDARRKAIRRRVIHIVKEIVSIALWAALTGLIVIMLFC